MPRNGGRSSRNWGSRRNRRHRWPSTEHHQTSTQNLVGTTRRWPERGSRRTRKCAALTRGQRSMSAVGLVSRVTPVQTALRNCTRDEGKSFEVGNQVLISSHRKLLSSKAMVESVAEK